jgi:hypothetical protein
LKYNKPLIAVLFGSLSTIPYELITRLFILLRIGKYSVYQLTSLIITLNRPTTILGMVVCFTVGGFFSILFYYSLKKLNSDFLVIKSMTFSLIIWVLMEAMYVWLIEGPRLIHPRPVADYYIHMFGSLCFGITQGVLYKKYLSVLIS